MSDISADTIKTWRTNYGLLNRTPKEAAEYWLNGIYGAAPAASVAALGTCIDEIERLRARLADQRDDAATTEAILRQEIANLRVKETRLAEADVEATSLLLAMAEQFGDLHPDWKPLPDVAGKITQINNLVAGLRARLAEAERLLREARLTLYPMHTEYPKGACCDAHRCLDRIDAFLRTTGSADHREAA